MDPSRTAPERRPYVGAVVVFKPSSRNQPPPVYAAIVTRVHQDSVDLVIFEPFAEPLHRGLCQHDPSGQQTNSWRWPDGSP